MRQFQQEHMRQRTLLTARLKKSFGRRNWPLHAQTGRVNTRHQNRKKRARRLPPFAAADLDAKRPVFGSKHFFRRAVNSRLTSRGDVEASDCIVVVIKLCRFYRNGR